MFVKTIKIATAGAALASVALLSACAGQNSAAPATTSADTVNVAQKEDVQQLRSAVKGKGGGKEINCSANGAGGVGPHKVDLFAQETKAGTVGCTEAFTVITEYYDNVIEKSVGVNYILNVQGWRCWTDTGAEGSHSVFCGKNGLSMRTAPPAEDAGQAQPKLRFPNTTQTVELTGYNTQVDMVEFTLVQWQPGGPNNGHYVSVPGDTGTHRLPLAGAATVLGAANLCPTGEVTVDDKGLGSAPCSKATLVAGLKAGTHHLAQIAVDGNDNIARVAEIYTP